MKTYIDHSQLDAIFYKEPHGETWIPKNLSNTRYQQVLKELESKEAELVPFVPPAPTWIEIRAQRDSLLKESDWIGASDAQPKPNKEAWLNYRQALRDITKTYSSPEAVIWPQKPIA